MMHAVFNDDGLPTGFYSEDLHAGKIPADAVEISEKQWRDFIDKPGQRKWLNGEVVAVETDQPAPTINDYENAIQSLVDNTAREKQFRDGVTLASYTASTKPNWAAEAQAFVAWRDNVWSYAYGELAKVQSGQREQPTVNEFLAEIAPIVWTLSD